jgi:hypothetical protein
MPSRLRPICSIVISALLIAPLSFAFDASLSDEAVREAYFLGQRHDQSLAALLDKYVKHLGAPKTGPYISSVAFFTPFAQVAEFSAHYIGNYSAQQAELDHRGQKEVVRVVVEIEFTATYGAAIVSQASSGYSANPTANQRSRDFWRDFQVDIYDDAQVVTPSSTLGGPKYSCGDNGPCLISGASLEFEVPAETFHTDTANIVVTPPEGSPVSVNFDLYRLR